MHAAPCRRISFLLRSLANDTLCHAHRRHCGTQTNVSSGFLCSRGRGTFARRSSVQFAADDDVETSRAFSVRRNLELRHGY